MDFSLTSDQVMLRDSVTRLLQIKYSFDERQSIVRSDAPWSVEIWKDFEAMGLLALSVPSDKGGLGGNIADIAAVSELLGEYLVVEPFISSSVLAGRILAAANVAAADAILETLVAGNKTAAFAHEEGAGTPKVEAIQLQGREAANGLSLHGEKGLVLGGAQADFILVSAKLQGEKSGEGAIGLAIVEPSQEGVTLTPFKTVDGRTAAHIAFEGVMVSQENFLSRDATRLINQVIADAMIALCAETVGALSALFQTTCEYASTRKQFGNAIISFQAISHRLADMKIAQAKAKATLAYTIALAAAGKAGERDISILKGQISKLGLSIGESAIQIHGGVGMTDELNVGHYHKRILANSTLFGDCDYHLRNVGQKAIET